MNTHNFNEAQRIEKQIESEMKKYSLDSVLLGVKNASIELKPFQIAGISLFAVRYCFISQRSKKSNPLAWRNLAPIAHLVMKYLLEDPLSFDTDLQGNPTETNIIFPLFRIYGNQKVYDEDLFSKHARTIMLYQKIPQSITKSVSNFDLNTSFEKISNVSLNDFINVGFTCFVASYLHGAFTRQYFANAKLQGINLPSDEDIICVLDKIAGDKNKIIELYNKRLQNDKRYTVYTFNPIIQYPVIRPWIEKKSLRLEQDRMIAPLPNLIIKRISDGIYYDLFNQYLEGFSSYFGEVFENYIGEILRHSVLSEKIISEADIRKRFPDTKGKVPDWIVIDGKTAILLECKTTRLLRSAIEMATEKSIQDSLKQIIKGLNQTFEFKESCKNKAQGLEELHSCNNFISIIVVMEPFYLMDSILFKEYINKELKSDNDMYWSIIQVGDLERLQPYILSGFGFAEIMNKIINSNINNVINQMNEEHPIKFEDTFLASIDDELFNRLGVNRKRR
jgi:hypothetical protein